MLVNYQSRANLNSVVGRLFYHSAYDIDPYQVLLDARQKVRMMGQSQQSFQELEDFLNGYYSKQSVDTDAAAFQNGVAAYIKRMTQKKLLTHLNSTVSGSDSHSSYIVLNTIKKRCEYIAEVLSHLSNNQAKAAFNKTKPVLNSILSEWDSLKGYSDDALVKHLSLITQGQRNDYFGKIQQLDQIYTIAKSIRGNMEQIYGEGFEAGLQAINDYINQMGENVTKKTISQVVSNTTSAASRRGATGKASTGRGQLFSAYMYTEYEAQTDTKQITQQWAVNDFVTIKGQPFTEKQGKMDINFTLPSLDTTFRISAKSWGELGGHDFGETSLQNAMLRTVNLDKTLEYGLVVGYYDSRDRMFDWIQAHEFAKVCALVDILMGYSQVSDATKGYADTIVIQDRSNPIRPIKVYSIDEILMKIYNNLQLLNVDGYDNKLVAAKLAMTDPAAKMNSLLGLMHGIKLSISSKILDI